MARGVGIFTRSTVVFRMVFRIRREEKEISSQLADVRYELRRCEVRAQWGKVFWSCCLSESEARASAEGEDGRRYQRCEERLEDVCALAAWRAGDDGQGSSVTARQHSAWLLGPAYDFNARPSARLCVVPWAHTSSKHRNQSWLGVAFNQSWCCGLAKRV